MFPDVSPPCLHLHIYSSFTFFCDHHFQFKACLLIPLMLPSATMFVSTYLSLAPPSLHVIVWNPTILFLPHSSSLSSFPSTADRADFLGTADSSSWSHAKSCAATCWPHLALHTGPWMKIIVLLMTQDRKHPQAHTYVSKSGTAEQQGACNLKSQLG